MRSRKSTASSKVVGCRRPPKATRFKKGKSGNLRGRPKGSRAIGSVLLDVTRQTIPVTENGRTRRMPALEVMLRRLTNEAIQNDQGALKLLFTLMERYADLTETTIAPNRNEALAEDQEILKRYLNDPRYIDFAVRQWRRVTGKDAVLEGPGQTFDEILAARTPAPFDSRQGEVCRAK